MPCAATSLLPSASTIIRPANLKKPYVFPSSPSTRTLHHNSRLKCRASSSSSSITDLDLYDLLGIDSTSDPSQIKIAYRSLQKRCHPDIAGPAGHDMAIILNDAYSVLSDPNSRLAYDKEQAKLAEFEGYTGKPLYSSWFGSETEERAVFVDEVKCVGCLKCALLADKTFAIESVYGRARVVGQWADPENNIQEAIEACPVDCISVVERSNLAALEYLMSKQPRGNVRMSAGNAVGARVSNIFVDIEKFQNRYYDAKNKASNHDSKVLEFQREARMSAALHSIRSISNRWYWRSPKTGGPTTAACRSLTLITGKPSRSTTDKIRDAAAARRHARENNNNAGRGRGAPTHGNPSSSIYTNNEDKYWTPLHIHSSSSSVSSASNTTESNATDAVITTREEEEEEEEEEENIIYDGNNSATNIYRWIIPVLMATVGAGIVGLQVIERVEEGGGLNQHIGGSIALDIVNSSWLQVILAWITWYLIGMAMLQLVQFFNFTNDQGNAKSRIHR